MRHQRRVTDERFDAAERFREQEYLGAFANAASLCHGAVDFQCQHPPKAPHLTLGELMIGMIDESGVVNLGHLRVLGEESRELERILAMALHADLKCLEASKRKPAVKRRGDRADRFGELFEVLV